MRHRRPFGFGGGQRMASVLHIERQLRKPHKPPTSPAVPQSAVVASGLAELTLVSAGTAGRDPHVAVVDATLADLTGSAAIVIGIHASVNANLGTLSLSTDARSSRSVALGATLGSLSASATLRSSVTGAVDRVLAALTASSIIVVNHAVAVDATLGALTGTAAAIGLTRAAALDATLGAVSLSADARTSRTATASATLGAATVSAAALTNLRLSVDATLAALTLTATGSSSRTAALTGSLAALTGTATAIGLTRTAVADVTLDALTVSADAMTSRTAAVDATLGAATLSAVAFSSIRATADASLAALTLSATGSTSRTAALNAPLAALTSTAALGSSATVATRNAPRAVLTLTAAAATGRTAALNTALAAVTASAAASTSRLAALSASLAAVTASATAASARAATLNAPLAALTSTAAARTSRVAAASVTLGALTVGASAGASSGAVATLVVNNVDSAGLPATAFWELGQPFADGDVQNGSIVTATFGGTSVPLAAIARSTYASGSLKWGLFQVDLSGVALAAAAAKTLVLSSAVGSWSSTTSRTAADWTGLVDTVELTNMLTSGTSAADMDKAGTWIAAFDNGATNTVETIGTSPLGLRVKVFADFVNTGTTHRFLRAYMEYWVTQLAGGGLGPVASFGPCLENTRMLKSNPSQFTYDINFKRNGTSRRAMAGIPHVAGTLPPFCRGDAQFEWTANEPAVVITRSIADLRRTKKIPPYVAGLTTYAFPMEGTITGISGAVFTLAAGVLWGGNAPFVPIAVSFRTTGTIWGGGSTTTTYWATRISDTTFNLYDTITHAVAGGGTGQIAPFSPGSGNFVRIDTAPTSTGPLCLDLDATGARPDIDLTTEWAAARVFADGVSVAAAQAAQRTARAVACAMSTMPGAYMDTATNRPISFLPVSETPAAMQGAADYSLAYNGSAYSAEFGGGSGPTRGAAGLGGWNQYRDDAHIPSPVYLTWLLEGKAYFRDLLFYLGNRVLSTLSYPPLTTYTDPAVGGGTSYPRAWILNDGQNLRATGWGFRDVGYALMACPDFESDGVTVRAEKTYFANTIKDNMDLAIAFRNYKGANYRTLGLFFYDTSDVPASTHNLSHANCESFMVTYQADSFELMLMLHGDNTNFTTNLQVITDAQTTYQINLYNALGWDATDYVFNARITQRGQPTTGAVYPTSVTGMGQSGGSPIHINYNTNGTITWDNNADWTLAVGDSFQPTNYITLGDVLTADPPSPLVGGTLYPILTVNNVAKTFTLNNGSGGTITFATGPTGLGGCFYPTASLAGFPSTGFVSDSGNPADNADGYAQRLIAGLAMASIRGVTGAAAAYTSANNRYVLGTPPNFTQRAAWNVQATL